jgi:uncharacterized protein YggU (UPF0235/DUF167 family)
MTLEITGRSGAVRFRVKVQARARREGLIGVQSGLLRLRVNPPPLEGRANQAVVALLAECLRIPKSSIKIAAGGRSSLKVVEVGGLEPAAVLERLQQKLGGG